MSRPVLRGRSRRLRSRWLLAGLGVAAGLGALGTLLERPSQGANEMRVAVLDFAASSTDARFADVGKALQSIVTTDLAQLSALKLVERARIKDVQSELKLSKSALVDQGTAVKMGKLAGATHLVVGSFTVVGSTMRIDCRLLAVATGQVVLADHVEGEKDLFFELEKAMVKNLVAALAVSPAPRERAAMARVQTSDFEALRKYGEGLALADEKNYRDAAEALRAATAKDPDFNLAKITLEQYEELIIKLRGKASAIENAKIDVKLAGEHKEAKLAAEVIDRLYGVIQAKGRPLLDRLVAMYVLMGIYDGGGRYFTSVWRYGDRYANARAADSLARSYWAGVPSVYPKLPLMFAYKWEDWLSACKGCVYDLKSASDFDQAFENTVKRMETAGLEAQGKPGHLRQEYLTEPFVSADRFVERLGLDRHEQARAWARLLELAIQKTQPPPDDRWIREQYRKLALAYRQALDLDKSTAMFLKASSGSDDARAVRDLTREVQANRDAAALLEACKPREVIEEYLRLFCQQNRPSSSQRRSLCASGSVSSYLPSNLTRMRDMSGQTAVLLGGEPMWRVSGDVGTGRRTDFMRSDELRYSPRSYVVGESHSLVLNGMPRKDLQVRFRVGLVEPADIRSSDAAQARARRGEGKPAPVQAAVAFVFGVRDVSAWVEDPHTQANLRPTTGWALQLLPDRIVLAKLDETDRKQGSREDKKTFSFTPHETQAAHLNGQSYDVSVKIDGAAIIVVVGGRTYRFRSPSERTGFFGFDFYGLGYVSVGQFRAGR
jgi:TolB-like protein